MMFKLNFNQLQSSLEIVSSIILTITCVYNYLNALENVCSLQFLCNDTMTMAVKAMFPRSLAVACLVSRITAIYKSTSDFPNYQKKIDEYELYFPSNVSTKENHLLFSITIVLAYVVIILPVNVHRIYLIYHTLRDTYTLLFYIMMYVQNLSICSMEIYFVVRCFGLYQKFLLINENMAVIKSETINTYRYPVVLQSKKMSHICSINSKSNDDSRANVYKLSSTIELFRLRHQFVREAFRELNNLYGIQVGMSLFLVFFLTLFDIYGEVFSQNIKIKSKVLIYVWLLQYSFRFCVITMTTHFTTKQVCKIML